MQDTSAEAHEASLSAHEVSPSPKGVFQGTTDGHQSDEITEDVNMGSSNGVTNDRGKTKQSVEEDESSGYVTDNMVCSIVVPLRGILLNAFIMQDVSAETHDALSTPAAAMPTRGRPSVASKPFLRPLMEDIAKVVAVGKNQVK